MFQRLRAEMARDQKERDSFYDEHASAEAGPEAREYGGSTKIGAVNQMRLVTPEDAAEIDRPAVRQRV